jgi:hypothetical protein
MAFRLPLVRAMRTKQGQPPTIGGETLTILEASSWFGETMRYAFHGKMRATGQVIDGYVEAANSEEAFNRLADQGIIGVHTVRGMPQPQPDAKDLPVAVATSPAPSTSAEVILTQLVDRMNVLIGHVETLLTRPAAAVGVGKAQAGGKKRRAIQQDTSAQNETLRAIFQTNLELRQSIQKFNQMTSGSKGVQSADAGAAQRVSAAAAPDRAIRQSSARPREMSLAQPAA